MRAREFIVEYKLSVSKDADGVAIKATAGGKNLGHAEFFFDEEGRLDPQTVWVDERFHGQGIARDMYDHLKDLGYTIVRSWDQTDAGRGFWNKHRGEDARVWEQKLSEISRDRLERYLSRAGRQVDSRQERMARARQRLNTSYEIYHADEPTKIVDRFEADTPADAQRYYQDYIERYESDRDYDLRLRRGTGIMESTSNKVSVADMIAYLKTHHDPNLHQDYTDYIENTFDHFVLKNVPTNSIPSELPKLDREKVERYRQMDFSKAPPIVVGDRYILDGYHRLNAAKILGIPSIRAYVGVKKVAEGYARKLNFDEIYGKYLKVTDNNGDPNQPGFSLVTPLNGASWNWRERPEFIPLVKKKLNQPGWLSNHKYQQIIDAMAGKEFDPNKHLANENFADGRVKGKSRPGRVKRAGASCKGSVTDLRAKAKKYGGEKGKMYHWCANMKSGRQKK